MWVSHAEEFPFLFEHLTQSIRRRGSSYETRSKDFTGYCWNTCLAYQPHSQAVCWCAVVSADVLELKLKLRLSLFKQGFSSLRMLLFRTDEEATLKYLYSRANLGFGIAVGQIQIICWQCTRVWGWNARNEGKTMIEATLLIGKQIRRF